MIIKKQQYKIKLNLDSYIKIIFIIYLQKQLIFLVGNKQEQNDKHMT